MSKVNMIKLFSYKISNVKFSHSGLSPRNSDSNGQGLS